MKKSALIFGVLSTVSFVLVIAVLVCLAIVSTFAGRLADVIDVVTVEDTLQTALYYLVGATVLTFGISYVEQLVADRRKK